MDKDTSNEVNIRCPIVDDVHNLWDFLSTDNYEQYKFTTVQNAHHATQALLEKMMEDLNLTDDA